MLGGAHLQVALLESNPESGAAMATNPRAVNDRPQSITQGSALALDETALRQKSRLAQFFRVTLNML
jgi:hypothetical protein